MSGHQQPIRGNKTSQQHLASRWSPDSPEYVQIEFHYNYKFYYNYKFHYNYKIYVGKDAGIFC